MKSTVLSRVNRKALRAALAVLGRTPAQIAASLRKRRIKALRGHPSDCALALYLSRKFKTTDVGVGYFDCRVGDACSGLTRGQANFARRFDNGEFPNLVR